MRIVFPNNEDAVLTDAQRVSVEKIAARFSLPEPVEVSPEIFGAVMVRVPGMWLGVETDGYTHA